MQTNPSGSGSGQLQRIRWWYALLIVLCGIFIIRLFYLQVIRYDHYKKAALKGQLKEYQVPAERGIIEAHDRDQKVPLVLNETRYTLFADPKFIQGAPEAARKVQAIIGGDANDYQLKMLRTDTRYVVLAKNLDNGKRTQLDDLKLKGVGTRDEKHRVYPQGTLAAQLLGFVNDDGEGKYGLEQALDSSLKGKDGEIKAITDSQGVPLANSKENLISEPQPGKRVLLTIDLGLQQQLEDILKSGLDAAKSSSGSAFVLEAKTGAIKAMANYPTYNPADFAKQEDAAVFSNAAVSAPLEVGSVMKPLTTAAALDTGSINRNSSYYDPGQFRVDDATITNIEEVGGAANRSVAEILQLSLNTGATWLLMQMGGGQINEQARTKLYDYFSNHYGFGKQTGIEQGFEAEGIVPDPKDGFGLNIQYANMAFGQGMNITPLQLGAALASIVNGGTYYRPRLVDSYVDSSGKEEVVKPDAVRTNVVKPETSQTIKEFMENVVNKNHLVYGMRNLRPEFSIGGKTGTAQIAKPGGGYYEDRFNGMFLGFVGGNEPQYIVVVRVNEPKIGGYAGSKAAGPIFVRLSETLINNFGVTPKQ